ncbi:MAG: hypothetical protein MJA30_33990 [Cytophagales bacterium]|nr:hypothetical protein [Cytophagales bacterium]
MKTKIHHKLNQTRLLLIAFAAGFIEAANGQPYEQAEKQPRMVIIGKPVADGIILRWAPTTAIAWQLGNGNGYRLERFTVMKNGVLDTLNPQRTLMATQPFKPLPIDDWEPIVQKNKKAAIAAQAIYGETFELTGPSSNTVNFADQSAELENRFSFALLMAEQFPAIAVASGLGFTDRSARPGEKYVYRVYPALQHADYPVDSGSVFVDPTLVTPLPTIDSLQAEFGDRSVRLSWDIFYLDRTYTAYFVEKSKDGGKTYTRQDGLPFINTGQGEAKTLRRAYYVDSLSENNKVYHYRVRGISPFGETGPPSQAVSGEGRETIAGIIPAFDTVWVQDNRTAELRWRFPREEENKIIGFQVQRATSPSGTYEVLHKTPLPPSTREFTDPSPAGVNYYVLKALGKGGETVQSFPALAQKDDNEPPSVPLGLEGGIDEHGKVTLTWQANTENDLAGYQVFRANSIQEQPVRINKDLVTKPGYSDSVVVKTLTKDVYYWVVAMDKRYNLSGYSTPLKLSRPDLVPPAAPSFTQVIPAVNQVCLHWRPSPSHDVAQYTLLRVKKEEKGSMATILEVSAQDEVTEFCDQDLQPDRAYEYLLYVRDSAGNRSEFVIVGTETFKGPVDVIKGFSVQADRENQRITLSWEYDTVNTSRFLIYRSSGGGPMRLYKTLGGEETQFVDRQLVINSEYTYKIRAVLKDGSQAAINKGRTVIY